MRRHFLSCRRCLPTVQAVFQGAVRCTPRGIMMVDKSGTAYVCQAFGPLRYLPVCQAGSTDRQRNQIHAHKERDLGRNLPLCQPQIRQNIGMNIQQRFRKKRGKFCFFILNCGNKLSHVNRKSGALKTHLAFFNTPLFFHIRPFDYCHCFFYNKQ